MAEPAPEAKARDNIDAQLTAAGWTLQDYDRYDPSAARGIALREIPVKGGRCDYMLLVDRSPVGVIEAKKVGTKLSVVAEQSAFYGANVPDFLKRPIGVLPFCYESTGVETFFRDERDPDPRSRQIFAFHRPATLADWLTESDTLRTRLTHLPPLATTGMRGCQVGAITSLEKSFAEARPRALIQMATGAGKTYTACAFIYRLIKYGGAKRVLFLVDRANLGRQAMSEFQQFVTPDTGRKFTELYNVQHLTSNQLDSVSRVTICTIQRLYSMLRGEELDEDIDEKSGFELAAADNRPRDVAYILAVRLPNSTRLFRLRRYNGRSHEHTNRIERVTFYDFHIHEATERYQDLGLDEDAYGEATSRYSDFDTAVQCLVDDCGCVVASSDARLF